MEQGFFRRTFSAFFDLLGNVGPFSTRKSPAPFSGAASDVGPDFSRCIKVREKRVCADLKLRSTKKAVGVRTLII
jgi:hypothetical protein